MQPRQPFLPCLSALVTWARRHLLAFTCALGLAGITMATAEELSPAARLEYQVKAGFLVNFGKLTEWPDEHIRAARPFRICVVDDGEAFKVMAATLQGKFIKGRPVELVRYDTVPELKDLPPMEILFVTRTRADQGARAVSWLGDAPVVSVGECPGFAAEGGRINFTLKDQTVRFEVNLESATRAKLKISSKMAAMATVVGGKEGRR
jgi:hypothetical protein